MSYFRNFKVSSRFCLAIDTLTFINRYPVRGELCGVLSLFPLRIRPQKIVLSQRSLRTGRFQACHCIDDLSPTGLVIQCACYTYPPGTGARSPPNAYVKGAHINRPAVTLLSSPKTPSYFYPETSCSPRYCSSALLR